jgi:hypothetical protein
MLSKSIRAHELGHADIQTDTRIRQALYALVLPRTSSEFRVSFPRLAELSPYRYAERETAEERAALGWEPDTVLPQ